MLKAIFPPLLQKDLGCGDRTGRAWTDCSAGAGEVFQINLHVAGVCAMQGKVQDGSSWDSHISAFGPSWGTLLVKALLFITIRLSL